MMNRQKKLLSLDCVNQVKREEPDDFDASIFSDVYLQAVRLVARIISGNNAQKAGKQDRDYSIDEQFNNIIAFLGGRGMGKSSAMLSFALFLKGYDPASAGKYEIKPEGISHPVRPKFFVLPRIDAAVLGSGQNVIDVILAKMWDEFEQEMKRHNGRDAYEDHVKEDFRKVQKIYTDYRQSFEEHRNRNYTSVRELHDLAAGLNLKKAIITLVEDFLQYMPQVANGKENEQFLVISLDDMDMTMGDSFEILEQVRMFLMIPKVIVLLTADLQKMLMSCKYHTYSKLTADISAIEGRDKLFCRNEVNNHIGKILPTNMRIYMPGFNSLGQVDYKIDISGFANKLYGNVLYDEKEFDEKGLILAFVVKYSGMMIDMREDRKHYLQKDSLRNIVNNLRTLKDLLEEDPQQQFDLFYRWYLAELETFSESFEAENMRIAKNILSCNGAALINVVMDELGMIYGISYTYGEVLDAIDKLVQQKRGELADFISALLGLRLSLEMKNPDEEDRNSRMDLICKGDYFYTHLCSGNSNDANRMEKYVSFTNEFVFRLTYVRYRNGRVNIKKMIKDNLPVLRKCFILLNLFDISDNSIWDFEFQEITGEETKKISLSDDADEKTGNSAENVLRFRVNYVSSVMSIDRIFDNALCYSKNLDAFILFFYLDLCAYFDREGKDQDIKELCEDPIWMREEYEEWQNTYDIQGITDILPLNSVSLMRDAAYEMDADRTMAIFNDKEITLQCLKKNLNSLLRNISRYEENASYKEFGYQSYHDIIDEYLDILGIREMEDEEGMLDDLEAVVAADSEMG